MNIDQRADLLCNCVAQLVAAQNEFVRSQDEEITPKHAFYKAADTLVLAFSGEAGDIPQKCWPLFLAVWGDSDEGGFKRAWGRFKADQDAMANPTWKPGQAVWSTYRNLISKMKSAAVAPTQLVPTVADLLAQGVSHQQIARAYRKYVGRTGNLDLAWVEHMKAHPEQNTPETRAVHQRLQTSSTSQWDAYAAGLASRPEIRRVREMLEGGSDPETQEREPQGPQFAFGEPEYEQASVTAWEPQSEPRAAQRDYGDADEFTVEQQALDMLDRGVPDKEITSALGITGQKLGAIKRRRHEIVEEPEMAGV